MTDLEFNYEGRAFFTSDGYLYSVPDHYEINRITSADLRLDSCVHPVLFDGRHLGEVEAVEVKDWADKVHPYGQDVAVDVAGTYPQSLFVLVSDGGEGCDDTGWRWVPAEAS